MRRNYCVLKARATLEIAEVEIGGMPCSKVQPGREAASLAGAGEVLPLPISASLELLWTAILRAVSSFPRALKDKTYHHEHARSIF